MTTPLINVCMITLGRGELLEQSLRTLARNTPHYTLTLFQDNPENPLGVGGAKNAAIKLAESLHGRGDLLYISDNDMYFTPGWSEVLCQTLETYGDLLKLVGGYCHPYSQPNHTLGRVVQDEREFEVTTRDAVGGASWLLRWDDWDRYGPLADNARGCGQSEDWEWCQRIRQDGFEVGAVDPWVVLHCGINNTFDMPSPGWEIASPKALKAQYPDLILK